MDYKKLTFLYDSDKEYVSVKSYSTLSKLHIKIDGDSSFIFPDKANLTVSIGDYGKQIPATVTSPYGDFYFSLSDDDFSGIGIGDFYFEVNVNVDTKTIYKITGGNIKINKSLYFKEVIPI